MSLPLGNEANLVAHRISLIQGNAVTDIVDLFGGSGADVAALQAKDVLQDAAIAAKQDQLVALSMGAQVPLLFIDVHLKPLAAGANVTLTDSGTQVSIAAAAAPSLSAVAPVTLVNDVIGLDLTNEVVACRQLNVEFDLSCGDLQAASLYGGGGHPSPQQHRQRGGGGRCHPGPGVL